MHKTISISLLFGLNNLWLRNWREILLYALDPFKEISYNLRMNEMDGHKAPGPDGFSMAFWQASWHFIKGEIM